MVEERDTQTQNGVHLRHGKVGSAYKIWEWVAYDVVPLQLVMNGS